jgi:ribose 5-phosphate isomerase B
MKVVLGADHNGFKLKGQIGEFLKTRGHEVFDAGDQQLDPADDFPQFAARAVKALQAVVAHGDPDAKAILICGSGQGMCIAANRFKGIRASLVWDEQEAHAARNDDDSNVLCLPAREMTDFDKVVAIVDVWLNTPFLGAERFTRRIKELDELA